MAARIAVIDVDEAYLAMMGEFLVMEGYTPDLMYSSRKVITRLNAAIPTVIVLDVWLGPLQNGWQVLDAIRATPSLRHLSVILCSGDHYTLQLMATKFILSGCICVYKPFTLDVMAAALRGAIGKNAH